jgi:hypothetical protein
MLGNSETGLPHPRVQADIADQLLRTGEAAHIADCRDETGGDDEIDTRDRRSAEGSFAHLSRGRNPQQNKKHSF